MLYQTKHVVVDAIQFTGADSIAAIQQWMAPQSPLYGKAANKVDVAQTLTLQIRDRINDVAYPSIAPNYKQVTIGISSWILRTTDNEFAVLTDGEFVERFELVGMGMVDAVERAEAAAFPPPAGPIDVLGEGAVPGDDVDPTGVVDTSHIKVGGTQSDDEPPAVEPSLNDF